MASVSWSVVVRNPDRAPLCATLFLCHPFALRLGPRDACRWLASRAGAQCILNAPQIRLADPTPFFASPNLTASPCASRISFTFANPRAHHGRPSYGVRSVSPCGLTATCLLGLSPAAFAQPTAKKADPRDWVYWRGPNERHLA